MKKREYTVEASFAVSREIKEYLELLGIESVECEFKNGEIRMRESTTLYGDITDNEVVLQRIIEVCDTVKRKTDITYNISLKENRND